MVAIVNVCIGVDVGGTNTDAVVLYDGDVIAKSKKPNTSPNRFGVRNALRSVLQQLYGNYKCSDVRVCRVNIGTTCFLNAVLQRKHLDAVAVIRLCGPASRALPPFCDFPEDLRKVITGGYYLIDGGYEFNGKEIKAVDRSEVLQVITQIKQQGMNTVEKLIHVVGVVSSKIVMHYRKAAAIFAGTE